MTEGVKMNLIEGKTLVGCGGLYWVRGIEVLGSVLGSELDRLLTYLCNLRFNKHLHILLLNVVK